MMKGKLEELGEEVDDSVDSISKVQTQILNLTHGKVNIFDDTGNFRDYYYIMEDIANVVDDLESTERAQLYEILFGKNRMNQGAAMIQAFQSGQIGKALDAANDSAGSAMAEQEKWMQSLEARLGSLSAAWQDLSQTIMNSDFLKGGVDTLTGFVNVLDTIIEKAGMLPTLLAGFAGVMSFKDKGLFKFNKDSNSIQLMNVDLTKLVNNYDKVSVALERYNSLSSKSASFQAAYNKTMMNSTSSFGKYLSGLNGAKASMGGYIASLVGGKVATIALQAATIALNAALTLGISAAITGLISIISKLYVSEEELAEKVNEVTSTYDTQKKSLEQTKKTLDELTPKYKKLSKGVNDLGENVSLTDKEYEEYLDITNQIADMFPELIQGYDAQGNAILSVKGNVEALTAAYEENIKKANEAIIVNGVEIFKDFKNKQDEFDESDFGGKEYATEANKALKKILKSNNLDSAIEQYAKVGSTNMVQIIQAFKNKGIKQNWMESGHDFIKRAIQENKVIADAIVSDFDKQLNESIAGMSSFAEAYMERSLSASNYGHLSESTKTLIKNIVPQMDYDFYSEFENLNDLSVYLRDLINDFSVLSGKNQEKLEFYFDLKTKVNNGECTIGEYLAYSNDIQTLVEKLKLDDQAETMLNVVLGLDDDGIVSQYQEVIDSLSKLITDSKDNALSDFVEGLKAEDFNLLANVSVDEMLNEVHSELEKLQGENDFDITARLKVDASEWEGKGWGNVKDGSASIFTNTYKNEAGNKAINFTPVLVDKDGNFQGVYSAKELSEYAKNVINNVHDDYLHLQIGSTFEGEYAVKEAEKTKNYINDLFNASNIDSSNLGTEELQNLLDVYKELRLEASKVSFSELMADEGFVGEVDTYVEKINTLQEALTKLTKGEFSDGDMVELLKQFPALAKESDNLKEAIKKQIKELTGYEEQVDDTGKIVKEATGIMKLFAEAFGKVETAEDIAALEAFMNAVLQLGQVVGNTAFSIDIDTEIDRLDALSGAINESVTGTTGVTQDSMKALHEMFDGLDGYDPYKLFERTQHGIHLNVQELRRLQHEYETTKKQGFEGYLQELKQEYYDSADAVKGLTEGTPAYFAALEKAGLEAPSAIREQIEHTLILQSQYEALTSAYNKWTMAQATADEDDMYSKLSAYKDTAKELYKLGKTNTDDFRSLVQLFTDNDLYAATNAQIVDLYEAGVGTYTRYFTDDANGILRFLNDALAICKKTNGEWISLNEQTKEWSFDFDSIGGDVEVARLMTEAGHMMSEEMVQIMLRASSAYGLSVDISSKQFDFESVQSKLESAEAVLKAHKFEPVDINVECDPSQIEAELDKTKAAIDKYQDNIDKGVNVEESKFQLEYAKNAADVLLSKLEQPAFMKLDTSQVQEGMQEALTLFQDYQEKATNIKSLEIKGAKPEEIKKAKEEALKAAEALTKLDPRIKAQLEIEGLTAEEIAEKIVNDEIKIPIKPEIEVADIDSQIEAIRNEIEAVKNDSTIPVSIKTQELETLNATLNELIQRKIELSQPSFMDIQVSDAVADIQEALALLQEYQSAVNNLQTLTIKGADTSEIDAAAQKVTELENQLAGLDSEKKIAIGLDADASLEEIKAAIAADEIAIPLKIDEENTNSLKAEIEAVDGSTVTVNVEVNGDESVAQMKNDIEGTNNKSVNIVANVIGLDTVQYLNDEIEELDGATAEASVVYDINTEQPDEYEPEDKEATVIYDIDTDKPDKYKPDDKHADVIYHVDSSSVDAYSPPDKYGTVTYTVNVVGDVPTGGTVNVSGGSGKASGGARVDGTAITNGKAFSQGNWGAKDSGTALGGELGQELVVRNGRFFTIGNDGAEFFNYQKNDIIFNAEQTKQLLENGKITSGRKRGKAFADGTIPTSGKAFSKGSGSIIVSGNVVTTPNEVIQFGGGKNSGSNSSSSKKDFKETFDWIEVAIDRIERAIKRLDLRANSIYNSWTNRNEYLKDQISEIEKEIDLQQQGYERYMQQANSVGLSEEWAKKVRDGLIDIDTIKDEGLAEKIGEYQEWVDKAYDCRDAIDELTESLSECYEVAFDNVVQEYDNILAIVEHERSILEERISQTEAKGYIVSTDYYKTLIENERDNIAKLEEEREKLIETFNNAINNNAIEKHSEAWYEMCSQIDEVTLAIEEANTQMIEYGNSIRDIEWSVFDLLQEQISQITDEANFLIDLMNNDKLYDDRGQLTNEGMSTMGLHGQNYNVYMKQADKYAEEMLRIEKQIANDPYNQTLIERRQELLELQRESILAAEDEKQAIIDMVEEGINLELDALQKLIDTYNESLNSQKDLFDYQKKVEKQTQNIASLEKQLGAYQNDLSEETRQKVQQIKIELQNAKDDLEQTEYEKYISDSQKMLDELYLEYETILNMRLDNIDLLLSDMILEINTDAVMISETLSAKAESVGTTLSDHMTSIWDISTSTITTVMSTYGDETKAGLTTIDTTLNSMNVNLQSMISYLSSIANLTKSSYSYSAGGTSNRYTDYDYGEDSSSGSSGSSGSSSSSNKSSSSSSKSSTSSSKSSGSTGKTVVGSSTSTSTSSSVTESGKSVNIEKPTQNDKGSYSYDVTTQKTTTTTTTKYSDGSSSTSSKTTTTKYYDTVDEYGNIVSGRYATGKKDFTEDEIAWTQEKGREFIVRPSDGAILTPIAEGDSVLNHAASNNIWDMANDPSKFIKDNLHLGEVAAPNNHSSQTSYTQTLENVTFSFPNVHSYRELLNEMQDDKSFEKLILSMTVDKIAGKSSLAKNKAIR